MRRSVLARLAVGWALLAVAWVFANPPFAAPDEMDHFVRRVGIASRDARAVAVRLARRVESAPGWVPWLAVGACGALLLASVPFRRLSPVRLSTASAGPLSTGHDAEAARHAPL